MPLPPGLPRGGRGPLLAAFALVIATAAVPTSQAAPRRNESEMQAREAFAAGRYQDALDLYVKLYAEQLHPNYLRNIGRCYQNLEQPARAISSFREYLRKARNVTPAERAEIDGYIAEMEGLERRQAQAQESPRTPPPPTIAPVVQARAHPPARPVAEPAPIYKRWWFWTALGVVAAGAAGGVILARGKTDLCPPQRDCGP